MCPKNVNHIPPPGRWGGQSRVPKELKQAVANHRYKESCERSWGSEQEKWRYFADGLYRCLIQMRRRLSISATCTLCKCQSRSDVLLISFFNFDLRNLKCFSMFNNLIKTRGKLQEHESSAGNPLGGLGVFHATRVFSQLPKRFEEVSNTGRVLNYFYKIVCKNCKETRPITSNLYGIYNSWQSGSPLQMSIMIGNSHFNYYMSICWQCHSSYTLSWNKLVGLYQYPEVCG